VEAGRSGPDLILLEFRGGDRLLIPLPDFRKVHKYVGAEGRSPRLSSLDTKSWERWREITKELRAKVPYWSCRGDHDLGPSGHFDRELGVDRPYFERERDGIHFFFLDSTTDFERGAQVKWLEERARVSQARHKIAVFHHPPYTIKEGREERAKRIFDLIHATLERLGFCAAFCGHDHHFFTTRRDRVRYVVTGGGGAPLYSLNPKLAKKRDRYLAFHHFVLCRSDANGITAKVYGPAGSYPEIHFVVCRHDGPVEE